MPGRQQLTWAQMRVGITVVVATVTLAVLIFLMTSTTGAPWKSKLVLRSYFENAGGLRPGAPVKLQGVDIGNVSHIRIVPTKERPLTPVEVSMRVGTRYAFDIRKDSRSTLSTAGVLGETFIDITSKNATGPPAQDGDVLGTVERPDVQDMIKSGQAMLQNIQIELERLDHILAGVENEQGTVGKLIFNASLFNKLNATLDDFKRVADDLSSGRGSVGKMLHDEELYSKMNASLDKLNHVIDEIENGKGSAGKFIRDPELYDNATQAVAKANKIMDDINAGRGTLGKIAKDPEFARKVDDTVARLNSIAERLDNGDGTASRLLRDPRLYTNMDQMLLETRNLVKAIRENPKKYLTIHLKFF